MTALPIATQIDQLVSDLFYIILNSLPFNYSSNTLKIQQNFYPVP